MPTAGRGTKNARHWTVEFGGTEGWIVSSWAPDGKGGWIQSGRPNHDRQVIVVRCLDDLDALIQALQTSRSAVEQQQEGTKPNESNQTTMVRCPECHGRGGISVGELRPRLVRCSTCRGKREVDEDTLPITRGEAKKLIADRITQAVLDRADPK